MKTDRFDRKYYFETIMLKFECQNSISGVMKYIYKILLLLSLSIILSCKSYYMRKTFDYPVPNDTSDKKIALQEKGVVSAGGVHIDNRFAGARMNGFTQINDTTFRIDIKPERVPVNDSPWYAFRIWADTAQTVNLILQYYDGHHRYTPKISRDGKNWSAIENIEVNDDTTQARFRLSLDTVPLWISAQELITTQDIYNWVNNLRTLPYVREISVAGQSAMGKDLPFVRIGKGEPDKKKVVVVLGRMHPPEVTGFMALQVFTENLLVKDTLSERFFDIFDIWLFPVLNPDGVDLGHWRYNANGVDLNRDWAYFRQPEVDAVSNFILERAKKNQNKIILGLDFHSMRKDTYFVFDESFRTKLKDFKRIYTAAIDRHVYPFQTAYEPTPMSEPYAKTWFYVQFKAESIIYEVGDETPRDIIRNKAKAAAAELLILLPRFIK